MCCLLVLRGLQCGRLSLLCMGQLRCAAAGSSPRANRRARTRSPASFGPPPARAVEDSGEAWLAADTHNYYTRERILHTSGDHDAHATKILETERRTTYTHCARGRARRGSRGTRQKQQTSRGVKPSNKARGTGERVGVVCCGVVWCVVWACGAAVVPSSLVQRGLSARSAQWVREERGGTGGGVR